MPQSYSPVYFPQDFASVSMSAANQFDDSCSDDASSNIGNYITWNAIGRAGTGNATLRNGNTNRFASGLNAGSANFATFGASAGRYYVELKYDDVTHNNPVGVGPMVNLPNSSTGVWIDSAGDTYLDNVLQNNGASLSNGNIIAFDMDLDNDQISIYVNDSIRGSAITLVNNKPSDGFAYSIFNNDAGGQTDVTIIADPADWTYSAKGSGVALITANLPAPTVTKPDDFFNTLLYTGNGGTLAVTGAGFQPDFVWLKCRSVATNWNVVDVVRGADAMLRMASSTNTEQSGANQEFESFDSDGFTVIHHGGVVEELNRSGATYVGYCMKAGGSPSSNVQGNVTSSVSAASHGGFSIGTFTTGTTGAITIGHGLSRAPGMIIVKDRVSTGQYWTFLESQGAGKYLTLNTTDAPASSTAVWNNTAPTATVFSTQDNGAWLTANNSHVFYAFAKTPGLIGMGTYTGNGSADGAFIQVDDGASGFKPAWVMVKRLEAGYAWHIQDAVRSPYNPTALGLNANDTGTDSASTAYDFIANGFKLRTTDGGYNGSASYMYLAFAENPFGGDGVAQARAR